MSNFSHRRVIAAAVLVTAACAATAAPAAATSVTFGPSDAGTRSLRIADGADVSDSVEVVVESNGFSVRDLKINPRDRTLTAGTGCRSADSATIRCGEGLTDQQQSEVQIQAFLGGGADLIRVVQGQPESGFVAAGGPFNFMSLNGGAGDDRIEPRGGRGVLDGGDGNDSIGVPGGSGSPLPIGEFNINGDGGNDTIDFVTYGAANRVSGGTGFDSVSYFGRPQGVTVDQNSDGGDGADGEGDTIGQDVEQIRGTEFDDTLIGGPANNQLIGDLGIDRLKGGGGFDELIAAGDGFPDSLIDCGPQPDTFSKTLRDRAVVELADAAPINCEVVESAPKDDHPIVQILTVGRARLDGRVLRVRLRCPRNAKAPCAGKLALVLDGRDVARRAHHLARGGRRAYALRVPRSIARRARRRALDVTIQAREKAADGRPKLTSSRIRLRGRQRG